MVLSRNGRFVLNMGVFDCLVPLQSSLVWPSVHEYEKSLFKIINKGSTATCVTQI